MSGDPENFSIVDVPRPGFGNDIAEQTARLILQELFATPDPTRQKLLETFAVELDGHLVLAAINAEGAVVGTGGLALVKEANEADSGLIVNVVVAPDERHNGLATRMMSQLEERARGLQAKETFGQPGPGYDSFYERLGYQKGTKPYLEGPVHIKAL
jgi:N-acetylglutamate synthase-like GNAT family acetyltransferase